MDQLFRLSQFRCKLTGPVNAAENSVAEPRHQEKISESLLVGVVLPLGERISSKLGAPGAVVSLTFDINLKNFDQPVSIEVPENVTMVESGS